MHKRQKGTKQGVIITCLVPLLHISAGRYETFLDMRMNNEIPKEVFSRKQQEVEQRIKELEQQMLQYRDVKPATEADVNGKLEALRRLMEQFSMPVPLFVLRR